MSSYYTGKKVLISGGSSGIGRAAAVQLASEGASVAVVARGQSALDDTVDAMKSAAPSDGQRFAGISLDVTDAEACAAVAAQVLDALGGLDVLINNAGYAHPLPFDELETSDFERMMNVNYMGHVHLTRALIPHFKGQQSGDICMVTSMLGFMGIYGYSAYCGSKFAIVGMAECLRQELWKDNIKVTVFYPPTTDTPGLARENEVKPAETWAIEGKSQAFSSEDVARTLLKGIRKGRFTNMIGIGNWFIYYANRFAPWLVRWATDSELKKHLKKAG